MQDPIEDFLDDVRASKAQATHKNRRTDLRRFDAYLDREGTDVLDAETWDIHSWLREESKQYSGGTVRSRFDSVKLLYDFLAGLRDLIDENPVDELKRSEYSETGTSKKHGDGSLSYVTPDEVDLLAEHVPDPKIRNELLLRLMFQTGARRNEVACIEVDDIDWESRSIQVYSSKTDEWRTVYYQPSLDVLLNQWLNVYRESYEPATQSPYLFVSKRGERIGDGQLARIVRETAEDAGIQEVLYEDAAGNPRYRVTPHAFRHGHAVHALKNDIDIRSVAGHLGHKDVSETMQYLQYIDSDVAEAYEKWPA